MCSSPSSESEEVLEGVSGSTARAGFHVPVNAGEPHLPVPMVDMDS